MTPAADAGISGHATGPSRGVRNRAGREETWRLSDACADDDAFRAGRDRVRPRIAELEALRGSLAESAGGLARALDGIDGVVKELNRLHASASMRSDTDTRVASCHAMREEVVLLWNDLSTRTAWVRPEILAMDPDRLREFLRTEPALQTHRHMLEDLLRRREHVLSPPEERILAEAGEALTGDVLSGIDLELLRRYHGHEDGIVDVHDRYAVEWASIPHFYYGFYVYQYSTGMVAATALAEAVLEDRPGARDRFLRSGGSDYPLELLREAGVVDLESP